MSEPWWADAAATRPIRVTGGIQINSTRGVVARTWWSKRFLSVLEQIGVGGRMARGRAYARQGQRRLALSTYERCVRNLREYLDVEPQPATIRIYEEAKTVDYSM